MEITCYRDAELAREPRHLPAPVYSLARGLLAHAPSRTVFVPIRAMQYLAIIDDEEVVFIDSQRKNLIDIAWQNFRPQQRTSLNDPVAYDAVFYQPEAKNIMRRLQSEFPRALQALATKEKIDGPTKVLKLEKRQEGSSR